MYTIGVFPWAQNSSADERPNFLFAQPGQVTCLAGFAFQKALSSSHKEAWIWLSGFAAGWVRGERFSALGF